MDIKGTFKFEVNVFDVNGKMLVRANRPFQVSAIKGESLVIVIEDRMEEVPYRIFADLSVRSIMRKKAEPKAASRKAKKK